MPPNPQHTEGILRRLSHLEASRGTPEYIGRGGARGQALRAYPFIVWGRHTAVRQVRPRHCEALIATSRSAYVPDERPDKVYECVCSRETSQARRSVAFVATSRSAYCRDGRFLKKPLL